MPAAKPKPAEPEVTQDVEEALSATIKRALANHKGTFFFERMISYGDFNNAKFGISVQFDYAPDATDEEFFEAARRAAYEAKSVIAGEAGLTFERDEEGVLHEVLQQFPGSVVVSQTDEGVTQVAPVGQTVGPNPPYDPQEIKKLPAGDEKKRQYNENSAWAEERYQSHPHEFWDNRKDKKYPNSHDFAHKTHKGVGFWEKDD